jgi:hypothetical protein
MISIYSGRAREAKERKGYPESGQLKQFFLGEVINEFERYVCIGECKC